MGDDRYCFLHVSDTLADHLLDEEDERLGWDLPDDDIQLPMHLLPSYQDEDDESVLPSASHPSYPYGNPYAPRESGSHHTSHTALHPSSTLASPMHSTSRSLATSLPVLALPHLFELTTFGQSRDRTWNELGLNALLEEEERGEEDERRGGEMGQTGGDVPQPTGQNAGDHPPDEDEMIVVDD